MAEADRGDLLRPLNTILKRSLLAGVAGVLALGLSTIGVAPARADDATTGATISGVVTLDGTPKAGLTVCAGGFVGPCVLTEQDGSYTLTNVVGWAYGDLNVATATVQPVGEYENSFPITDNDGGTFTVEPGAVIGPKNIEVKSFPVVSGTVVDKVSEKPIVGAEVCAGTALNFCTRTDETGSYTTSALAYPGSTASVSASGVGYAGKTQYGISTTATVDFQLTPVTGSVAQKVTSVKPTISGKAKVGRTLKVHAGAWGPAGVQLSYQWYRNGHAIKAANAQTYKLTKKDRSKKIAVKVSGSADGYASVAKKSKATKKVTKR
jgi:hypothetical protein